MKYVFVNPLELLSTLFHAGEVTVEQINTALQTPRTLNYPCGFNYNEHNQSYSVFFHTDKETKKVKWTGKNKDCIQLNIQPNQKPAKKQAAAATPGQVLPQTAGAPVLTQDVIAALTALGIEIPGQAKPDAVDETDFSEVSVTL